MSKMILILFGALTMFSLFATYRGVGLNDMKSSSSYHKQIRSSHSGIWLGSSGGGFSSGK